MEMQRQKPVQMRAGPSLEPSNELLKWLNDNPRKSTNTRRMLRLPIVVEFEDDYRLNYERVYIGGTPSQSGNVVLLDLDDTALGMGLLTQLQRLCPKGQKACALWLEGYWGALVEYDDDDDDDGMSFSVLKVGNMIDAVSQQVTTIFVEAN
ncbi:MAG TPA: hypothetical protein EYN66_00960 [Myxococcales bacterium]|nr:hypothetical protein [Myxococcales bacterium]